MVTFYQFAPTLQALVQSSFLARQLEEGLDSELAFRRHATEETIEGRIGSTITFSKTGRKGPVVAPLNPANLAANLDNGLTPSTAPIEQYQLSLSEWGDTEDVDLIGTLVQAADAVKKASRTNGVQAAQSQERLAKIELFNRYNGGNSWVRGDLGANSTALVHVDDIRGFTELLVNGVPTAVSATNPLTVFEMKTSPGGVSQQFSVTGFAADAPNNSLYPGSAIDALGNTVSDGISGTLTISPVAAVIPATGDSLIAVNAPKVVRPLNKPSYNILNSGDVATLGLLLDAKTRLSSNGVPPMSDGTYHFIHDYAVNRQLFADQQFLLAYASRYKSTEYQEGQIFELLGITFIPTTEAYVQPPTTALAVNVPVRRSILMGADSLIQGNFDGLDMYLNVDGMTPIGAVMMVNGIAQIIRPPLDRMLRVLSLTWTWVGSFTCPSDATATPLIIPTASNARYKRAVVIETAG